MATRFAEMYAARVAAGKRICIGLDPDLTKIPSCVTGRDAAARVYEFITNIVNATYPYAAAFKPQIAFFEELGDDGHKTLRRVLEYARLVAPEVPIILDYKRGDIGNTNRGYVGSAFDYFGVEAVTVHPYLGMEAMKPFLEHRDKLIIVLCRTSNPGAGEFQDIQCSPLREPGSNLLYSNKAEFERETGRKLSKLETVWMPMSLYQFVAHRVAQSWGDNCAVVVGATYPAELKLVREIVDNTPILIPGLGSQGGKVEDVIPGALDEHGWGVILNNASAINFAFARLKDGDGKPRYTPRQYPEAAEEAARTMNDAVGKALSAL